MQFFSVEIKNIKINKVSVLNIKLKKIMIYIYKLVINLKIVRIIIHKGNKR